MNVLSIERLVRPGEALPSGGYKTGRVAADFLIDGESLLPAIQRVSDLIPRLGWGPRSMQDEAVAVLLLELPADLPDDRRALYVCPECGDLACGTVTAVVERKGTLVSWSQFRYETATDPPIGPDDLFRLGPFSFSWDQYVPTVRGAHGLDGFSDGSRPPPSWWNRPIL